MFRHDKEVVVMRTRLGLTLLLILLSLLFIPSIASAACWDYWDLGSVMCTGQGGCQGEHEVVTCTFGCVSGDCFNHGGSGLCCGKIYYSAAIYPDGGDCSGRCPEIRAYAPTSSARPKQHDVELRRGYTPGLIVLSDHFSHKPPLVVYVLDHCSHSYGVIEQDAVLVGGGW